jgi:anti-sigma factor RsiW
MTESETYLPPEDEADLVALADGNLSPARRAEMEARVAAEPRLAFALSQQRAALVLLSTAGAVSMPPALQARVVELEAGRERSRRRLRLWLPAFGAAMATAAAAIVLMVAGGGPGVHDVITAALRPATAEAAPREQIDGLRFPHYYDKWRAVGSRADVIGGRSMRTVFYERDGKRIAYTIVARPALDGGGPRRLLRIDGRQAVQWTRADHTCLISGDVDPATLVNLATWKYRERTSTAAG